MVLLIKIKIFFLFAFFAALGSKAQSKDCSSLKILVNIEHKILNPNDTIKIVLQNRADSSIQYQMDVIMCHQSLWSYSPYYTRYFNHDLDYTQLNKIFKSKLPVTFSQDYKHPANSLNPLEIKVIYFVVDDGKSNRELIKFRFKVINEKEDCNMIYSNAFYFRKIKEE